MDKETLLSKERKLATLFVNSRKKNRLSNAYLLYGTRNAPLKEVALYLAKSLSCERDLLACNQCDSCVRFDKGIHPDFYLIDGSVDTIKKESVKSLLSAFSLSALEKGHTLSYVIHRVDNITDEAANTLLKFLEEPREGQIAFLTTDNITRVLPTIRSRSIEVRVDPIDVETFYQDLQETTFTDEKGKEIALPITALYVLSRLFPSKEEVRQLLSKDDSFRTGFDAAESFLNALARSERDGALSLLESAHQIKESACYNWMYLTIDTIFEECLFSEGAADSPFADIERRLSKNPEGLLRGKEIVRKALSLRQINLSNTAIAAELVRSISEEK